MTTTHHQPTHDETKARIAARAAVTEIIALVDGECKDRPVAFVQRLWQLLRDQAVRNVGLPAVAAREVQPLNELQAEAFRQTALPFGKYQGHTIAEIEESNPDYLAMLADGNDFTKHLRRYLARQKYSDADE